jgi:transcriptional regulator with XRE-family HTH domain
MPVLGVRVDGERLRRLLLDRAGTTLRAMVAYLRSQDPQIKVSDGQLSDWCAANSAPQPDMLARILRVLDADVLDVLLKGTRETLLVLRWRAGLTAVAAAKAAGISRPRYNLLEAGETPTDVEIAALAKALGAKPDVVRAASRSRAGVVIGVPLDADEYTLLRELGGEQDAGETIRQFVRQALRKRQHRR